jgi:hypothetical protein
MIKTVKKFKLGEEPETDLEYWLTLTPNQRLAALEQIRQNYINFFMNGNRSGFQRVYTVIK